MSKVPQPAPTLATSPPPVPTPPAATPATKAASPGAPLLARIEQALDAAGIKARVMTYFGSITSSMTDWDVGDLFEGLDDLGDCNRLAFLIETPGGDPDAAHLMSRALHARVRHLDVFVLNMAASAGTLFSLGADQLWMGPSSRLGPIDPQVPVDRKLLFPSDDPFPGYTHFPAHAVRDFLEFVGVIRGDDERPDVDLKRLDGVMQFRLNPMLLGNYERADKVSKVYAHEALTQHLLKKNMKTDSERAAIAGKIIHAFLDKYASHSAGILRDDARALGVPVSNTPDDVWSALRALSEYYYRALHTQKLIRIMETTTWASADQDFEFLKCPRCGEKVLPMHHCTNCGDELFRSCPGCQGGIGSDWKFCGGCGCALAPAVPAPPGPPPPASSPPQAAVP